MKNNRVKIARLLLIIMILNVVLPASSYATKGPSQPEVQSFAQVGDTQLVDPFSGDFKYNIPLFELPGPNGGYPINLSYQSGITLEQEASWVGLGWSLNGAGAITRSMRGFPDDFKGDNIVTKFHMKPNTTIGASAGAGVELFGKIPGIEGKASLGGSIIYNNYNGFSYKISGDMGLTASVSSVSAVDANAGISLDSDNGASLQTSIGLTNKDLEVESALNASVGMSYNSRQGLASISADLSYGKPKKSKSVGITFGSNAYTPSIEIPMSSTSIYANFKGGGAWWGAFPYGEVGAFLSTEHVKQNAKGQFDTKAFGYFYHQHAGEDDAMDLNRQRDGIISSEIPNLPIPIQTYDMFTVQAHGIGKSFRAYRNDVGMLHNASRKSKSKAGSLGVDVGPLMAKAGANLEIRVGSSKSSKWVLGNELNRGFDFTNWSKNSDYEPYYFKCTNDLAFIRDDHLSGFTGDSPITLALKGKNDDARVTSMNNGTRRATSSSVSGRVARSVGIQAYTNDEIINGGLELLNIDNITSRTGNHFIGHHIGGFIVTDENGIRYVFGLPAFNVSTSERVFYTKNGEKTTNSSLVNRIPDKGNRNSGSNGGDYYKETVTPVYAHSYLLTAIVGPDYVDIDNNGASFHDEGYWVKFDYKQAIEMDWKTPYVGGMFQEMKVLEPEDDKVMYTEGQKQVYYLEYAATKSHVVQYFSSPRNDAHGAIKGGNSGRFNGSQESMRLDSVKLLARQGFENYKASTSNMHNIRTARFSYNYCLCQGEPSNSAGSPNSNCARADVWKDLDATKNRGSGKLTLTKVVIVNGDSEKGTLRPYIFEYGYNPNYTEHYMDAWGYYNDQLSSTYAGGNYHRYYPYLDQNYAHTPVSGSDDDPEPRIVDRNVSAWSMNAINLPQGSRIEVTYESDDYAYVQHRRAMKFIELESFATQSSGNNYRHYARFLIDEEVKDKTASELARIYLGDEKQLYFKIFYRIKANGKNDYVTGYVEVDRLEKEANGNYARIYLKSEFGSSGNKAEIHPFKIRALDWIRNNAGYLLTSDTRSDKSFGLDEIKELLETVGTIKELYKGYYLANHNRPKIAPGQSNEKKSWIRVQVPVTEERAKYGGGLRVKRVEYHENFAGDASNAETVKYGSVYEYTTKDGLSSGVATFEPSVGKEENPFVRPKFYNRNAAFKSSRKFFFEYPINESYYPGGSVGYSRVTIKSLPTAAFDPEYDFQDDELTAMFPDVAFGTTGYTEQEFYTACDYPVEMFETDKGKTQRSWNFRAGAFLYSTDLDYYTATQGYSAVTNDMHGKPKGNASYRQLPDGSYEVLPYNSTEYIYWDKTYTRDNKSVRRLDNAFSQVLEKGTPVLVKDPNGPLRLGMNREVFVDVRQSYSVTTVGGFGGNIDMVVVPLFIFGAITVPVPSKIKQAGLSGASRQEQLVRTAVSNKITAYNGILKEVRTTNEGALFVNSYKQYDRYTGRPILTETPSYYGKKAFIMDRVVPGYSIYDGMGPAFHNLGIEMSLSNIRVIQKDEGDPNSFTRYRFTSAGVNKYMFPGDEFVIFNSNNRSVGKGYYLGKESGSPTFYSSFQGLSDGETRNIKIIRSGRRNHLQVDVMNYKYVEER